MSDRSPPGRVAHYVQQPGFEATVVLLGFDLAFICWNASSSQHWSHFGNRDVITKVSYAYQQLFWINLIIVARGYCKLNIPSLITFNSGVSRVRASMREVGPLL